ncbi:MAG: glycosyltransferase [Bacteroidota bacterium]
MGPVSARLPFSMMPQKILHILWQMDIGGAERAVYQLVREQRRRGIDADVLLGSHAGFYGEKTRALGANVYELGQKHTLDFSVSRAAREIMRSYDIAHFHSAELGLIYMASRTRNLRRFYTHRGGVFRYPRKQALRYRLAGFLFRRYFAGISGNTTQGATAASRLFAISPKSIPTTYNGIDFSLLAPNRSRDEVLAELGPADDVLRIGTSANLRPWKRIELLLDAVARLKESAIHCYIIGDGPSRAALEEHGRRLGISHLVTFTGKKEHIGDYLQLLDIFVLPSGPEESFGNSAVEAMGVGLPTIVFADGGGLVEHIDDGVTGFLARDVDDLTAKLETLIADRALRTGMGERALRAIHDKYSLEAMVERYGRLYNGDSARRGEG